MSLRRDVQAFIELVVSGQREQALRRFYAPDVIVFENRELARAGRDKCVEWESKALAEAGGRIDQRAHSFAVDEATQVVFIEWLVRFTGAEGRPFRLEQVAVQKWERGQIAQERFYFEGYVDEGD